MAFMAHQDPEMGGFGLTSLIFLLRETEFLVFVVHLPDTPLVIP